MDRLWTKLSTLHHYQDGFANDQNGFANRYDQAWSCSTLCGVLSTFYLGANLRENGSIATPSSCYFYSPTAGATLAVASVQAGLYMWCYVCGTVRIVLCVQLYMCGTVHVTLYVWHCVCVCGAVPAAQLFMQSAHTLMPVAFLLVCDAGALVYACSALVCAAGTSYCSGTVCIVCIVYCAWGLCVHSTSRVALCMCRACKILTPS